MISVKPMIALSGVREPALLVELQGADRHHRLGHGGDVEDRVARHRGAGGLVAIAEGLEIDELAAPRDGEHRAGQLFARDLGIDRLADQGEALGGHADLLRLCPRQRISGIRDRRHAHDSCGQSCGHSCGHEGGERWFGSHRKASLRRAIQANMADAEMQHRQDPRGACEMMGGR